MTTTKTAISTTKVMHFYITEYIHRVKKNTLSTKTFRTAF